MDDKQEMRLKHGMQAGLLVGVSLAALFTWYKFCFQDVLLYSLIGGLEIGDVLLDQVNLSASVVSLLTFFIACAFPGLASRLLQKRYALLICSLGLVVASCIMILAAGNETFQIAFAILSGSLAGMCYALFTIHICVTLSTLQMKNAILATAVSLVLSSIAYFLIGILPAEASATCIVALPLCALVALRFSDDTHAYELEPLSVFSEIAEPKTSNDTQNELDDDARRKLLRLCIRIALCAFLVSIVVELDRTIFIRLNVVGVSETESYMSMQGAASALVTIGAVLITLALLNTKATSTMLKRCYRFSGLFLIIGSLCVSVPSIFSEISPFVPFMINTAAGQCFSLFLWAMTAGICCRYTTWSVRCASLVRGGATCGTLFGLLLGWLLVRGIGPSLQSLFSATAIGVLLIAIAIMNVFTETDAMSAMDVIPLQRKRRFAERCETIAKEYGLTKRESEIFVYLAKGRNAVFIQQELFLSAPTVSTHRQHIYQKLGIHSAQELIDLVQKH